MGFMKDEMGGQFIHRRIFIQSKVCALKSENQEYIKKIKGVRRVEVKNSLSKEVTRKQ